MKRDNVNYLVVGLFVVASLCAFLVLMYFVTGRTGPTDRYIAYYENVTGLKFGTGVFYEGYRVGQVERVEPEAGERGMRYKVTLGVAQDWRIPADSIAQVVSSGLIAQVQIEIREGRSDRLLAPGDEIRGLEQTDLFSVLSQAASGITDLSQTGVVPVLENLNYRITQVAEDILKFRQEELSPILANLDRRLNQDLANQAQTVLQSLDASAQRLQRILGPENERRIGQFLGHIDDVALNLNQLVSRIEATRLQMNQVLSGIGQLVTDNDQDVAQAVRGARLSMQEMEATLSTINENIDTVMYHLEGSSRQMHELARALRQNPSRLLKGVEGQAPEDAQ